MEILGRIAKDCSFSSPIPVRPYGGGDGLLGKFPGINAVAIQKGKTV